MYFFCWRWEVVRSLTSQPKRKKKNVCHFTPVWRQHNWGHIQKSPSRLTFQRRVTANISAGNGVKLNMTPWYALLHNPLVLCQREKLLGFTCRWLLIFDFQFEILWWKRKPSASFCPCAFFLFVNVRMKRFVADKKTFNAQHILCVVVNGSLIIVSIIPSAQWKIKKQVASHSQTVEKNTETVQVDSSVYLSFAVRLFSGRTKHSFHSLQMPPCLRLTVIWISLSCSWDNIHLRERRSPHHIYLATQWPAEHSGRPAGSGLQHAAEGSCSGQGGERQGTGRLPGAAHSKTWLLFVSLLVCFAKAIT